MSDRQHLPEEVGQTAVLFALMIIGLVLFVGLAVDGGSVLNERRVTQNAADSAALTGVHYMTSTDGPTETRLQEVINGIVESNGLPDSDGTFGNTVNDFVTIYYTDDRGNRLETQPCYIVPCGSIPGPASGLEVALDNEVDTFLLGIAGRDSAKVGANAVAVAQGGIGGSPDIGENAMVALGDACDPADIPMDMSGYYVDVIGDLHSNSYFENRGSENHYHGQVTYGIENGFEDRADVPGVYDVPPAWREGGYADPYGPSGANLSVDRFDCTTGDIGSAVGTCHDLTNLAQPPSAGNPDNGRITTRVLVRNGLLNETTGELAEGLYYAGNQPFFFGWNPDDPDSEPADDEIGMHGEVTLVTGGYIKITERDVQLNAYMDDDTPVPGLLMYSGLVVPEETRCTQFENLDDDELPINTTGNSGSVPPKVWHAGDPDTGAGEEKEGCFSHENTSLCYEVGSLQYNGILYAPGGKAATSGHGASYVGAVIADSIRINGYVEYEGQDFDSDGLTPDCGNNVDGEVNYIPCRPFVAPEVGALFVHDANLLQPTERLISLER